jgi:hypothetical protein
VDALAVRGDEGRGTLRYASGRCEQPVIRRSPNGETHLRHLEIHTLAAMLGYGFQGVTRRNLTLNT